MTDGTEPVASEQEAEVQPVEGSQAAQDPDAGLDDVARRLLKMTEGLGGIMGAL